MTENLPTINPSTPSASTSFCPKCGNAIIAGSIFCTHCGQRLQEEIPSMGRIIFMYAICFCLPPFGLPWAFKYMKSQNPTLKKIGYWCLGLTVFSIILTLWAGLGFINSMQQQFNQYSNLGI